MTRTMGGGALMLLPLQVPSFANRQFHDSIGIPLIPSAEFFDNCTCPRICFSISSLSCLSCFAFLLWFFALLFCVAFFAFNSNFNFNFNVGLDSCLHTHSQILRVRESASRKIPSTRYILFSTVPQVSNLNCREPKKKKRNGRQ